MNHADTFVALSKAVRTAMGKYYADYPHRVHICGLVFAFYMATAIAQCFFGLFWAAVTCLVLHLLGHLLGMSGILDTISMQPSIAPLKEPATWQYGIFRGLTKALDVSTGVYRWVINDHPTQH